MDEGKHTKSSMDASPRRNDSDSKDKEKKTYPWKKKQGEVGIAESKSRNAWTLEMDLLKKLICWNYHLF